MISQRGFMKNKNVLGVGLLLIGLGACITAPRRLENIPLMWKPTSEVQLPPGTLPDMSDVKIQFEAFKDMRKQPELIAENREEAIPKPVTTHDNVGQFASAHVREVFDKMGLTTVDKDGALIVSGEVRQFFVEETTTYKGNVLLRIRIRNRAGKTLWAGDAAGTATRFGHSYSADNYYEVFSDSIVNAVSSLMQDAGFRAALARKK
jgi:hypothetical protein